MQTKYAQLNIVKKNLNDLKPHPQNPRTHPDEQKKALAKSLEEFSYAKGSICIQKDTDLILAGHEIRNQLMTSGYTEADVIELDFDDTKSLAFLTADNQLGLLSEWDEELLQQNLEKLQDLEFDLDDLGFSDTVFAELVDIDDDKSSHQLWKRERHYRPLADDFIVPPFSVLDTKQGYWRDRKSKWWDLGIVSEEGRDANLLKYSKNLMVGYDDHKRRPRGTSEFDPVLCEIMYSWFCPPGGKILDPFAGGSVRGIVAGYLGYDYIGIDLNEKQIEANKKQADEIQADPIKADSDALSSIDNPDEVTPKRPIVTLSLPFERRQKIKCLPKWIVGDSNRVLENMEESFDFIFSCPPYYDLEIYGDLEGELSAMPSYEVFLKSYRMIIHKAVRRLKNNSFACFVVGDIRDKDGFYRNFISDTIAAYIDAGMRLYNEAILLLEPGLLAQKARRIFIPYRKLGKAHQNVLIFYKGAIKKIFSMEERATLAIEPY